jgi:autophagy-related protein 13
MQPLIMNKQSASFLSTNTDDDDISAFVQDIDSRRPLNGHDHTSDQLPEPLHDLANVPAGRSRAYDVGLTPSESYGNNRDGLFGAMLTSEPEVDEKLIQLNSAFLVSLEGLEGSLRDRRAKKESPSPGVEPPHQPH